MCWVHRMTHPLVMLWEIWLVSKSARQSVKDVPHMCTFLFLDNLESCTRFLVGIIADSSYNSAGKDVNKKDVYHQQGAHHLSLRCCIPDGLFSFSWPPWTALWQVLVSSQNLKLEIFISLQILKWTGKRNLRQPPFSYFGMYPPTSSFVVRLFWVPLMTAHRRNVLDCLWANIFSLLSIRKRRVPYRLGYYVFRSKL